MLSEDELDFLNKMPAKRANKVVVIKPFSSQLTDLADEIINKLKNKFPELTVRHMGASGLGISGQGDLDIYALANQSEFAIYLPGLTEIFGKPIGESPGSIAWKPDRGGTDIEFYLTDPDSPTMRKQIRVFEILRQNPPLLAKYEKLKSGLNGATYKEYQRAKYEFYHRIMDND
jgi:GrpB-like predicted nucleotidyltransferase (UPF0157 family)